MADSPFRLARIEQLAAGAAGPLDLAFWTAALGDHAMFPHGVCCHPDPLAAAPSDRFATTAAAIADPRARTTLARVRQPVQAPFEPLDYAGFLAG